MDYAVDLDTGHGDAGQRRQKDSAQAVAQRDAENRAPEVLLRIYRSGRRARGSPFRFGTFISIIYNALLVKTDVAIGPLCKF